MSRALVVGLYSFNEKGKNLFNSSGLSFISLQTSFELHEKLKAHGLQLELAIARRGSYSLANHYALSPSLSL